MPSALVLRVFLPFALGYLLSSIFRSINAVLAPALVADLGLNASQLGFAVGMFYLAATVAQIPYGILLDRYDPRRLYATFLVICAAGAAMTAYAQDFIQFTVSRAFIAVGTTASAVTSYRVYAMWYPPERLALANGLSLAAGGLGLMCGTWPVEAALRFVDWRDVHLFIAALLLVAAALVPLVAPRKEAKRSSASLVQQIVGLRHVILSPAFWRVAPMMFVVIGSFGAFSSLWAGPWVRDVAGFSGADAAGLLLLTSGAMMTGGLMTGLLAGVAKRLGLTLTGFGVAMAILWTLVMGVVFLQWTPTHFVVLATWALVAFTGTLCMVFYAALAPQFPAELIGRLNACVTLFWMFGAFAIQNLYGVVLDWFPSRNGAYAPDAHRLATGLILVLALAALAWFFVSPRLVGKTTPPA